MIHGNIRRGSSSVGADVWWRLAVAVGGLALATLLQACDGRGQAQLAGQGPPPTVVELTTLQPTEVSETSEFVATLKALRSTEIRPEVEGYITRILVTSGDRVQAGTPLVQIDQRRQAASVSSQESAIAAREADVAYARQQADRLRGLYAERVVSKEEVDRAETALKTAEADLASLQARLREQRVQLQYFQVLAPTAGMIGDIPVRVGDRVTASTMLTTLDQNDTLELLLPIPVERAPDLRAGLPVEILDVGGRVVAGTTITFVSPRAEAQTQSVLAKGLVRNESGLLRSSQYVRTRVRWKTSQGLVVPVLSVLRVNDQSFAFVAESQQGGLVARQRPIKVGQIVGDNYTVLGGLKPGERIVVSGVQRLINGAPIQTKG